MTSVTAERLLDGSAETVEAQLPCLVTATKHLNAPRYPKMSNIFGPKNITSWTAADLQLNNDSIGLEGSASVVISSFSMKRRTGTTFVEGENGSEQAINLLGILHERHII